MRTDTFEHNGARVTVREKNGAEETEQPFLANVFAEHIMPGVDIMKVPSRLYIRCLLAAAIVQQTESVEGDLGIAVPGPYAPDGDLFAFHDTLFLIPEYRKLLSEWSSALDRVNQPLARNLHEKPKDPEPPSDVEKSSETSEGQSTVA